MLFPVYVLYCGGKSKTLGCYPKSDLKALINAQATHTHTYGNEFEIVVQVNDVEQEDYLKVYTCKDKRVVAMRKVTSK